MRSVSRKEKKFLLDAVSAAQAQARVASVLHADPHNGTYGYPVRSLYFDTPDDRDFWAKIDGLRNRRKVRLRTYGADADFALLELKQKTIDNQRKRGLRVSRADAMALCHGNLSCLRENADPLAQELYVIMTNWCYQPRMIVEYDRAAYVVQENSTRVTFDKRVRATEASTNLFDPHLAMYPVIDPFNVILEVKFNTFLMSYVRQTLGSAVDRSEVSVSKYIMGRGVSQDFVS